MSIALETEALTVNEVGLWMGAHPNTVKRIPPSDLPFFRLGNRGDRRYLQADVISYIVRRMVRG